MRHLRCHRHLCQRRSAGGRIRRRAHGSFTRAGVEPGHPARSPCHVFYDARHHRLIHRALRDRDPPPAAHRGAGGRGVLLRGTEGFLGDAAQAQSHSRRKPDRPRPHGARLCNARHGKRGALARARYLAFLGGTHDRPRRHRDARLRAASPGRYDREAGRLSREYEKEPRQAWRACTIRSACCWR